MSNLSSITLEDLAAQQEASTLKLAKAGGKDAKADGEGFQDPFTIGQPTPVEFTTQGTKAGFTTGTIQLELGLGIVTAKGVQKAGRTWIDLPLIGAEAVMTAEEEQAFLEKAGARFLKFLRAIDPVKFNVFASIDKSNPKKWVYVGHDGQPMNQKARQARAEAIDKAVISVAEAIVNNGGLSLVGERVTLTKANNPNNPKKPYSNWSPYQG